MDKAQFKALAIGQVIYHTSRKNADGSRLRARVNGQFREFRNGWYIPMKYGIRGTFRIGTDNRTGMVSEEYRNPANWLEDDI